MSVHRYHGTYYTRRYYNFSFEIVADSTEDANAKALEYFKNEANHDSIIRDAEQNPDDFRWCDHKRYFLENAQVDSAFRDWNEDEDEDEDIDVFMSL